VRHLLRTTKFEKTTEWVDEEAVLLSLPLGKVFIQNKGKSGMDLFLL
jgi:hypothetical protein